MRILITGGAGFLGSEIVNKISNIKNVKLTVIDDLSRGYRQRLKKNIKKINIIKRKLKIYKKIYKYYKNKKYNKKKK